MVMPNTGSPQSSRAGAARRCGRLTRVDLLTFVLAATLCWASYTLSVWHNNRGAADGSVLGDLAAAGAGADTACGDADEDLDFASHHAADDAGLSVSSSGAAVNPAPRRALRAAVTAPAAASSTARRGVAWAVNSGLDVGAVRGAAPAPPPPPEALRRDGEKWKRWVARYKAVLATQLGQKGRVRNLLDMNARLDGFAAALADDGDPVWVMNVVPAAGGADTGTLLTIYEQGLVGAYHDWCEPFPTAAMSYDLLHADSLFTLYRERCDMEGILLEMDRILRPVRTMIIRDDIAISPSLIG